MQFIYPAAAMVFYIFLIGLYNFRTRAQGVRSGAFKMGYFKLFDSAAYNVPEYIVRVGRHYNNQFELPLLYLITCVVATQMHLSNPIAVGAAWLFLVSRLGHSYYHLGSNHILKRAGFFFLGWFCVLAIWGCIVTYSL